MSEQEHLYTTPQFNYKNFAGKTKSAKLHFRLTPREFADWMIDNRSLAEEFMRDFTQMRDDLLADEKGDASMSQKATMLRLVRVIAEISYGVPDSDGEVFDKSGQSTFRYSAVYEHFRLWLYKNPNELGHFIGTLMNEAVIAEFANDVTASAGMADPETGKEVNIHDLSPDEIKELLLKKFADEKSPETD